MWVSATALPWDAALFCDTLERRDERLRRVGAMVSSKVAPANEAEESPSKQGGRARARGAGSARGGEARASFKGPKRAPLMLRLEEHERQIEELQKLTAPDVPPKTAAFALANLNKGLSEGYLTTPLHRAARAGDAAGLESLLRDDSKKGVNRRDEIGWQPLLHAACVGQRLSVQVPLDLRAPRDNATRVLVLEEVTLPPTLPPTLTLTVTLTPPPPPTLASILTLAPTPTPYPIPDTCASSSP